MFSFVGVGVMAALLAFIVNSLLKADRSYELEDFDSGRKQILTGKELAEGLRLDIADTPGSMLLIYKSRK